MTITQTHAAPIVPALLLSALAAIAAPSPARAATQSPNVTMHSVTSASAGHGSVDPSGTQDVVDGATPSFSLTPDTGYHFENISGLCIGTYSNNDTVFTLNAVHEDCGFTAHFAVDAATTITASSGTPQSAELQTAFALPLKACVTNDAGIGVPNVTVRFDAGEAGNHATAGLGDSKLAFAEVTTGDDGCASVSATANDIAGSYTDVATAPYVEPALDGSASFALTNTEPGVVLNLLLDDEQAYAAYGQTLLYQVTVSNSGSDDDDFVQLSVDLPPQLDETNAKWCTDTTPESCTEVTDASIRSGPFTLAPNASENWFLQAPVKTQAAGATATLHAAVVGNFGDDDSADDVDTLVLFRDGFDTATGVP